MHLQVPVEHLRLMTSEEGQRQIDMDQVEEIKNLILENPNVTTQPLQTIAMPTSTKPADVAIADIIDPLRAPLLSYTLAVSGGQHGFFASTLVRDKHQAYKNHKNLIRHDAQVIVPFVTLHFYRFQEFLLVLCRSLRWAHCRACSARSLKRVTQKVRTRQQSSSWLFARNSAQSTN